VSDTIDLSVGDDMRLYVHPREVGRDAEHNSATFHVKQPSFLDQYVCRAEVRTEAGTTYRLVDENGEFALTNDMTVRGPGRLQLVYSDGTDVLRKTSVAAFHVSESLNAVDESAPGFGDGLAQVADRAFAQVGITGGNILVFYNIAGLQRGMVTVPGGGADIPTLDLRYLQLTGGRLLGSIDFLGDSQGLQWQRLAALYETGAGLVIRQSLGDAGVFIEESSGASATRSPILTQATGLPRAGGQMTGPLIAASGGSLTNMGLAFGDNATGFYRSGNVLVLGVSGGFVCQFLVDTMMLNVPIVMGNQRITTMADATADQDGLNRRSADARYLRSNGGTMGGVLSFAASQGIAFQPGISAILEAAAPYGLTLRQAAGNLGVWIEDNDGTPASRRRILVQGDALTPSGGQLTGTLITVPGSGQNDLGLGIGDINTGFHRSGTGVGADLMVLVVGFPLLMLTAGREAIINGPLSMTMNRILSVGDATTPTDALNRQSGDARYLQLATGGNLAGPLGLYAPPTLPNDAVTKGYVDSQIAGVVAPTALRTLAYTPNELAIPTGAQTFFDVNFPMPATGLRNILVSIDPAFGSTETAGVNWDVTYATTLIALESTVVAYKIGNTPTSMFRCAAKFTAVVDATPGSVRVLLNVRADRTGLVQVGANGTIAPNQRTVVTVQDLGPVGAEEMS
jgi:hypothetical protein